MVIHRVKSTKSLLMQRTFPLVLLLCLSSYLKAQTAASVEDLVKSLSKGTLQVETKATPHKLIGDFNGDKIKDVAVIVSLSDTVEKIEKTVKVQYPYVFGKDVNTDILALFIIHGQGKGWEFAQKSSVLLLGRNSALIFQKDRLDETGDAMQVKQDRGKKASLYLITEGADGTIKWNGKKYVWSESQP